MSELYKRRPNIACLTCSKQIYRRPGQIRAGRVFCSAACYGVSSRKEVPCIVCGIPILAGVHKKTCSRSCANRNRAGIRYNVGSPRDKVKDQRSIKLRLIAVRGTRCERCGYDKVEILNVHHKDRNRKHNMFENLELICPNCHAEEHYLENSWISGKLRE